MADIFDNSSLLMFRVGPVYCCAPSFPVESIIQPPAMTRTPGSDHAHPGLFRHAGNMVSGLDLRYQFGVEQQDWIKPGRIIIAGVDAGVIGFWVDQIIEVMQMPQSGWGPLPALLPRGVFSRTLLFKDKIYLYADFEKLFSIPTSGYLKTYIEHLVESEQRTQQKSAVGRSSTLSGTNYVAKSTLINAQSSSENQSDNNIHPIHHNKPGKHTEKTIVKTSHEFRSNTEASSVSLKKSITSSEQAHASTARTGLPGSIKARNTLSSTKPLPSSETKMIGNSRTSLAQKKNTKGSEISSLANKKTSKEGSVVVNNVIPKESLQTTTVVTPASTQKTGTNNTRISSNKSLTSIQQHDHVKPSHIIDPLQQEESSSAGTVLFTLFLLIGIGTISYWLWMEMSATTLTTEHHGTSQVVASVEQLSQTNLDTDPVHDPSETEATTETAVQETETITTRIPENTLVTESSSGDANRPAESRTPKQESPSTQINEQTEYKADIVRDEEGITIILDSPDTTSVFNKPSEGNTTDTSTLSENISDAETRTDAVAVSETLNSAEQDEANISPEQSDPAQSNPSETTTTRSTSTSDLTRKIEPAVRQSMTEIIHIVKKGDTLWHIAIRYVENPYRYPELARLSNIKNPDLIYPGNRVRIIQRRNIKE